MSADLNWPGITRHFATLENRQVHYHRAGEGPAVVLIHQSPSSSDDYLPLIADLARDHTVIAPDTPGNGLSDPLPVDDPAMSDYADGVVELLDVLRIDRAQFYGFHTGAMCVLALAERHPERVVLAVANGYVQNQEAELADILEQYFPKTIPEWSGSHLIHLWARIRNQFIFFPWYRHRLAYRLPYTLPGALALHGAMMQLLRAGNDYVGPYRAAFSFSGAHAIREARAPTLVMTAREDVLFPHLDRMPVPACCVEVRRVDSFAACIETLKHSIRATSENASSPPSVTTSALPNRIWRELIPVEGGMLHARRGTRCEGRPIVYQANSFLSSRISEPLMRLAAHRRAVLAIDLPGTGDSDVILPDSRITVENHAEVLVAAIERAGYRSIDLVCEGTGAAVGVAIAIAHSNLVKRLAIVNPVPVEHPLPDVVRQRYAPAIPVDEYGAHCVTAWNIVRSHELYAPWFERHPHHAIHWRQPNVTPEVLHDRTLDFLKCLPRFPLIYAAHLGYPLVENLARLQCEILLMREISVEGGVPEAVRLGQLPVLDIPQGLASVTAALLQFFGSSCFG